MRKVFISNNLIRDRTYYEYNLHHKEFYLYVLLKLYAQKDIVRLQPKTLLQITRWSKYSVLKKYLRGLKQKEVIDYSFNDNDFRKVDVCIIHLLIDTKNENFTIVDEYTINRIIECCQNVLVVHNKTKRYEDLKEQAIKLFFYYEMKYYGEEFNISYKKIKEDTGIHYKYIKAINNVFNDNKIVIVNIGDKKNNNIRNCNTYIPICNRD